MAATEVSPSISKVVRHITNLGEWKELESKRLKEMKTREESFFGEIKDVWKRHHKANDCFTEFVKGIGEKGEIIAFAIKGDTELPCVQSSERFSIVCRINLGVADWEDLGELFAIQEEDEINVEEINPGLNIEDAFELVRLIDLRLSEAKSRQTLHSLK
ncbi:MAG: hypothetical protein A2152_01840 [Candidatus Levybacteria bacterium RBG_16_35_6]|nr:MAG: hypothetical protein A2152_01840 [Candidatus Levybacteria bacterium RBG_16_35_6]